MINYIFSFLDSFENLLWGYLGFPILMFLGIYLTWRSSFVQIRQFPHVIKTFFGFLRSNNQDNPGVPPLRAFFACIGGCVGVGNIVGICSAIQIGGPGALFWIWITALVGAMVKYAEVFLGHLHRIPNGRGGFNGGPMYFLRQVFKRSWIPNLICLLLCIYGVEVYQFSVVTTSISVNFDINLWVVVVALLALVIYAGSGGVKRVGAISSAIIPFFVVLYISMSGWVLLKNISLLPSLLHHVFVSAFTGHAALGGFVGSTLLMTISQGIRRGCYTGDLGIGYASVIHSESSEKVPERQAMLVIFEVFLDTFVICTSSVLLILASDVWHQPMEAGMLVQAALENYFPYMNFFMPLFLFILGYSTINAYFCVGLKCAEFLFPAYGRPFYFAYAAFALFLFSFVDSTQAQTVMQIVGGLLLTLNAYGIFKMRHQLSYHFVKEKSLVSRC